MDELCDRLASALKITDVKRLNDIKALLYADDVALIAHSRTELQKMDNLTFAGLSLSTPRSYICVSEFIYSGHPTSVELQEPQNKQKHTTN
eukprot:g31457.t1